MLTSAMETSLPIDFWSFSSCVVMHISTNRLDRPTPCKRHWPWLWLGTRAISYFPGHVYAGRLAAVAPRKSRQIEPHHAILVKGEASTIKYHYCRPHIPVSNHHFSPVVYQQNTRHSCIRFCVSKPRYPLILPLVNLGQTQPRSQHDTRYSHDRGLQHLHAGQLSQHTD